MGSSVSEHRIRACQWWFGPWLVRPRHKVCSVRFTGRRSHYFTWFVSPASNRGNSPFPHPQRGSDLMGSGMSAHRIRACQWWFGALARPSQTLSVPSVSPAALDEHYAVGGRGSNQPERPRVSSVLDRESPHRLASPSHDDVLPVQ